MPRGGAPIAGVAVAAAGLVHAAGERVTLAPAGNAMQRSLVGAVHRGVPPIVSALLGPDAGLVGAAELARRSGDQPRR